MSIHVRDTVVILYQEFEKKKRKLEEKVLALQNDNRSPEVGTADILSLQGRIESLEKHMHLLEEIL